MLKVSPSTMKVLLASEVPMNLARMGVICLELKAEADAKRAAMNAAPVAPPAPVVVSRRRGPSRPSNAPRRRKAAA